MKLETIKSEKDIKSLLLEEMKKTKNKRLLIILSEKRFEEFRKREDVREDHYDLGDYVLESDDINYHIYENEYVGICKHYGTIVFSIIAGLYMVKEYKYFHYSYYGKEAKEIHFIE